MTVARKLLPIFVLVGLVLSACAGGGQTRLANDAAVLGAPDPVIYAQSETEEYTIGPQDRLSINVYPVRDFSIPSVRVTADGSVLVPPIGSVRAQGKTATALAAEIQAALIQCCLQRPQVVVQVEETISRQITVSGAVKTSNYYNLRGRMTLTQAVAMAGGPDPQTADTRRVGVIRMVGGQRTGKVFNLQDIQANRAEDPEIFGGDQIIVDTSDSKSTWRNIISAMPFAALFTVF